MTSTASLPSASALTDVEIAYLECEREHWGPGGVKQQVVFDLFGVSVPVFYQRLYRICERREAIEYDAALVRQIVDLADDVTAKRLQREGAHG